MLTTCLKNSFSHVDSYLSGKAIAVQIYDCSSMVVLDQHQHGDIRDKLTADTSVFVLIVPPPSLAKTKSFTQENNNKYPLLLWLWCAFWIFGLADRWKKVITMPQWENKRLCCSGWNLSSLTSCWWPSCLQSDCRFFSSISAKWEHFVS